MKIIMKKACFVNRLYSYLDKFLHLPMPIVMLELLFSDQLANIPSFNIKI